MSTSNDQAHANLSKLFLQMMLIMLDQKSAVQNVTARTVPASVLCAVSFAALAAASADAVAACLFPCINKSNESCT